LIVRELVTLLGFRLDDRGRQQYNRGIEDTRGKQDSLAASFFKAQALYGVAQKAIGAAFSFVRDSVIGATAETERYRVTLGTMMGDQEKANKIIHDLDYSAVSDFYGTANAIGGLQGMVTFGMQAEEASDMLTRIGDIAQGNSEAFVSMSNNMGQVFAKGKADATDLKQFVMQGFDVVGEVAKQSGKSREEIQKAGVSYEQAASALKALTSEGGKYNGMLAKQMNTLGGVIKQFASLKAATAEAIGTGISKELKDLLKYILEIARAGQETFVGAFVSALKTVIHWIYQIIITFEILQYRLEDAGLSFEPLKQLAASFGKAVEDAVSGIFPFFVELGALIVAAFGPIQAFASPIIEELGKIARDVFTAIADFIHLLVPEIQGLTPYFEELGGHIGQVLAKARVALRNIMDAIKATFAPIKAFVIPILEALKPIFMDVFNTLGGVLDNIGESTSGLAVFIEKLTPLFRELGRFVGDVIGFLWQFKDIILAVIIMKEAWAVAQWALNVAMNANPIGLIITAIGLLIFGIYELVKNWDKVKEGFANAGGAIANFFSGAGEKIKSFASSIEEKVGGAFNSIKTKAQETAQNAVAVFAERFPNIYAFIVDVIEKIKQVFGKIVEIIKPPIEAFINLIKTSFQSAVDVIKEIGVSIFTVFKTVFTSVWNVLKTIFTSIWNVIKSVFDSVKNIVMAVFNVFKTIFFSIFNVIKGVFRSVLNTALSVFDGIIGIWRGGGSFFSKLWESIRLIFTSAWNGMLDVVHIVADAFIAVWNSVKNVFVTIWQSVAGVFSTIWNGIVNVFSASVDGLRNIFDSIVNGFVAVWNKVKVGVIKFVNSLKAVMTEAVESMKKVWGVLIDFFSKLWNMITVAAIAIWKSLLAFVRSLLDKIKQIWDGITIFFSQLWENIVIVAMNIWNVLKDWFGAFIEGVETLWGVITEFFSALWNDITAVAMTVWNTLKEWFSGLVEGIKKIWNGIIGFFSDLWNGIVETAQRIWEGIVGFFSRLIGDIKGVWNGIIGFFSDLWEAIKQGPNAAIEFIRDAFTGLFNGIQEKLLGFINKIKEGWETVKGFFDGVVDGVVNFFTGGDTSLAKDAPTKVNDMILTPDGQFETNPNDYIMAMQDPGALVRNGREQGGTEMGASAELAKAVVVAIQSAAGAVIAAIRGIVFGTNSQYSIVNETADNRSNTDNRAYNIENADNRVDNRAYNSITDNRDYNSATTTASYSYDGNESYNAVSENDNLTGLFTLLYEPLMQMVDMLARFSAIQQPQPALAGVPTDSLMGSAMTQSAAQSNIFNSSSANYSQNYSISIPVSVNAGGMTPEQAQAAVQRGVQDALKNAINSSRGNIPSPEARRY
jgi:phage-related protein